ncbi:hypothetical protein [Aerosakkonema funiforme]
MTARLAKKQVLSSESEDSIYFQHLTLFHEPYQSYPLQQTGVKYE